MWGEMMKYSWTAASAATLAYVSSREMSAASP